MSKVLVDPAALEEAAKWLEVHSSSSGSSEAFAAEALREAIAQPAEVEGSVEMGSDAWMALHLLDRLDVSADEEPRVQQVEEIVRRMGAALSAATAERDRLLQELAATNRGINAKLPRRRFAAVGTGALYAEQNYCYRRGWNEGVAALRAQIRAAAMAAKEA